jgi:peptidoglycan hydrolase CwlO-like protein
MDASQAQYELDRVPSKRDWLPIFAAILLALFSLSVSGWAAYSSNDKANVQRIQAVETQQKNDGNRLDRIENKIGQVDEKIDKLLERR